jgi:hypothetical protein
MLYQETTADTEVARKLPEFSALLLIRARSTSFER